MATVFWLVCVGPVHRFTNIIIKMPWHQGQKTLSSVELIMFMACAAGKSSRYRLEVKRIHC